VTSQAAPQVRFRRAIDARSVRLAELCALEMRHLMLADALELVVLYAETNDAKFDRAACRWLSRLTIERDGLTLAEAQLAASALLALPTNPDVVGALLRGLVVAWRR
jgi:hypothetical protein